MMNNNTIEKLLDLKLGGMAEELQRQISNPAYQDLPFEQRIRSIVDHEVTVRDNRRLTVLLRRAHFPVEASVEDIDYQTSRGMDTAQMLSLASINWVREKNNLVITGPAGTGKTWLACAIGYQACRMGLYSLFVRVPILMEQLTSSRATNAFLHRLAYLKKFDLLILDDWGIESLSRRAQNDLLELIDSRLDNKATLITSQMPMSVWHDGFENKTIADAVMDRIINSSYHVQLKGESLRKKRRPLAKLGG